MCNIAFDVFSFELENIQSHQKASKQGQYMAQPQITDHLMEHVFYS